MEEPVTSKSGGKKIFDIAPPGQTTPSATSRPLIITNKPEQADRTVQTPVKTPAKPLPTSEPTRPPVNLAPHPVVAELPTDVLPLDEPISEPESTPGVQAITHKRLAANKKLLWLIPMVVLIIVIIGLLEHYHVL